MNMKPLVIALLVITLTACSSKTPTMGDRINSYAYETQKLGDNWKEGDKLIAEGNKLEIKGKSMISQGKKLVDEGEDMLSEAKSKQTSGRKLKAQSETSFKRHTTAQTSAQLNDSPAPMATEVLKEPQDNILAQNETVIAPETTYI